MTRKEKRQKKKLLCQVEREYISIRNICGYSDPVPFEALVKWPYERRFNA